MTKTNDKKQTKELKSELIDLYVQTFASCCPRYDVLGEICLETTSYNEIQKCSTRKCPYKDKFRHKLENIDTAAFFKAKK